MFNLKLFENKNIGINLMKFVRKFIIIMYLFSKNHFTYINSITGL